MSVHIETKAPATTATKVRELAWKTVQGTREQWIMLGNELQTLKAETLAAEKPKSDWYALFGEDSKRKPLKDVSKSEAWPFGSDRADKLIKVAEAFGNVENTVLEKLPPSWGTLHALTNLTTKRFKTAMERGDIHPGMTREEANALKPKKEVAGEVAEARDRKTAKAFLERLKTTQEKLAVVIEVLRDTDCTLEQVVDAWKQTATQHLAMAA